MYVQIFMHRMLACMCWLCGPAKASQPFNTVLSLAGNESCFFQLDNSIDRFRMSKGLQNTF